MKLAREKWCKVHYEVNAKEACYSSECGTYEHTGMLCSEGVNLFHCMITVFTGRLSCVDAGSNLVCWVDACSSSVQGDTLKTCDEKIDSGRTSSSRDQACPTASTGRPWASLATAFMNCGAASNMVWLRQIAKTSSRTTARSPDIHNSTFRYTGVALFTHSYCNMQPS